MPRKGDGKKPEKKEVNYKEFEYDGKEFKYSGRIYPENKTSTEKCDITPMNITLNGVITIKGCKLMQTDDKTWINFPQYQDKEKKWQSYFFIPKEFEEIVKVAEAAEKAMDD